MSYRVYRVTVRGIFMDMSGGDAVDGPRWTGDWVPRTVTMLVTAESEKLAAGVARVKGTEGTHPAELIEIEDLGKTYVVTVG